MAERQLPDGRHPAKFLGYDLGVAKTGREQIAALFEFTEAPFAGQQLTWYGSFTPEAFPITVRALKALGWRGERIDTLRNDAKVGTMVDLVCQVETFEGKQRSKIQFINRRGLKLERPLDPGERRALAERVQDMLDRKVHESATAPTGAGGEDDDIPF